MAPRIEWYGGWSPPFRYALIGLPLLALALVPLLARAAAARARGRSSPAWALSLWCWPWSGWWCPGWTYNFADGRTYVLDIARPAAGARLARLFPSSIRPRPATWLWPPLSLLVSLCSWWLPETTRRPGPLLAASGRRARREGGLSRASPWSWSPRGAAAGGCPPADADGGDRGRRRWWKSGGHLYPGPLGDRAGALPRGWVLRVNERLEVPVEPGGRRVRLTLHGAAHPQSAGAVPARRAGRRPPARHLESGRGTRAWDDGDPRDLRLAGRGAAGSRRVRAASAGRAQRRRCSTGWTSTWHGAPAPLTAVVPTLGRSPLAARRAWRPCGRAARRDHRRRPGRAGRRSCRPGSPTGSCARAAISASPAAPTWGSPPPRPTWWRRSTTTCWSSPAGRRRPGAALEADPAGRRGAGSEPPSTSPACADGCGIAWNRWWQAVQIGHGQPAPPDATEAARARSSASRPRRRSSAARLCAMSPRTARSSTRG